MPGLTTPTRALPCCYRRFSSFARVQLLILRDIERKVRLSPTWLATMFERSFWRSTCDGIGLMRRLATLSKPDEAAPDDAGADDTATAAPGDGVAETVEAAASGADNVSEGVSGGVTAGASTPAGPVAPEAGASDVAPDAGAQPGDVVDAAGAAASPQAPATGSADAEPAGDAVETATEPRAPAAPLPDPKLALGVYSLIRDHLHSDVPAVAEAACACISHVFVHALQRDSGAYVSGILRRADVYDLCKVVGASSYPPLVMQAVQLLGYLLAVADGAPDRGGAVGRGVGGLGAVVEGGLARSELCMWLRSAYNVVPALWVLASRDTVGVREPAEGDGDGDNDGDSRHSGRSGGSGGVGGGSSASSRGRGGNGPSRGEGGGEASSDHNDDDNDDPLHVPVTTVPLAVRSAAAAVLQALLLA